MIVTLSAYVKSLSDCNVAAVSTDLPKRAEARKSP